MAHGGVVQEKGIHTSKQAVMLGYMSSFEVYTKRILKMLHLEYALGVTLESAHLPNLYCMIDKSVALCNANQGMAHTRGFTISYAC